MSSGLTAQAQGEARQPVLPTIECGAEGVLINCDREGGTIAMPDQGSLGNLIGNTVSIIILIFALLAVIFVVKGGISLILSLGNEDKRKAAVRTIFYALVGLVVAILAYAIVSIVSSIRLF